MVTDGAKMCQKMKPLLKEYHTRAQKREFKRKVANIAKIQPSVVYVLYKELALDSSVSSHPDTETRVHAMFLGETGLIADLWLCAYVAMTVFARPY